MSKILFLAENGSNREFLTSVLEKQYEIQAAAEIQDGWDTLA